MSSNNAWESTPNANVCQQQETRRINALMCSSIYFKQHNPIKIDKDKSPSLIAAEHIVWSLVKSLQDNEKKDLH